MSFGAGSGGAFGGFGGGSAPTFGAASTPSFGQVRSYVLAFRTCVPSLQLSAEPLQAAPGTRCAAMCYHVWGRSNWEHQGDDSWHDIVLCLQASSAAAGGALASFAAPSAPASTPAFGSAASTTAFGGSGLFGVSTTAATTGTLKCAERNSELLASSWLHDYEHAVPIQMDQLTLNIKKVLSLL